MPFRIYRQRALITFLTSTLLLIAGCTKGKTGLVKEEIPSAAVILFTIGDVRSEGSPLKPGDVVPGGKIIETGVSSSCDLQLRGPEAGVAIRLQPSTRFTVRGFQAGGEKTYRGILEQGVALFSIDKLRAKENIEAQAPTAIAGVRGTGFLFSFLADTAVASVKEGKLSMRPAMGVLENQTGGMLGESRVLTNMYDAMQNDSTILEGGQTNSISRSNIEEKYEGASAVIDLIARAKPGSDTAQLVKTLDEKYGQLKYGNKPTQPSSQPRNLQSDAIGLLSQSLLGLSPVETEFLTDAVNIGQAITQRNQTNQTELLGIMSQVKQQKPETLMLRDGRRVTGLIYEQGGAYVVETPIGTQMYPRGMVEGYAF